MIPVTLGELVLYSLGGMLAGIFGAWLLSEWRRQRRERHAFRDVLRCSFCGSEFEGQSEDILSRCPNCGTLNERFRLSRL